MNLWAFIQQSGFAQTHLKLPGHTAVLVPLALDISPMMNCKSGVKKLSDWLLSVEEAEQLEFPESVEDDA